MKSFVKQIQKPLQKLIVLLIISLFLLSANRLSADNSAGNVVDDVLAQIAQMESYSYSARAIDTAHPLPLVDNIGRTSTTQYYNIDADVNLVLESAELGLTSENGNLFEGLSALFLKIEDGVVYTRPNADLEWQVSEEIDPTQTTANRPEHFLEAATEIQLLRQEHVGDESWQVYGFTVNSVRYAGMMRDMIQAELRASGDLPEGQIVGLSDYYLDMQGGGEFWLDADGLLRRQTIHVVYPAMPGAIDYHELEMTADYSEWTSGSLVSTVLPSINPSDFQSLLVLPEANAVVNNGVVIVLAVLLMTGLLIVRSRRAYAFFAVAMTLIFVAQPLLQVVVYAADQIELPQPTAQESALTETDNIEQIRQQVEQDALNSFDPEMSPIDRAALANRVGALSNSVHGALNVAPLLAVSNVDTDGDGLEDHVEVNQLGLSPNNPDTDGDHISDGNEVKGFTLNGQKFYLDPKSPDSNGDGIVDSAECPSLINIDGAGKLVATVGGANATCRDSDNDGTPDYADDDNDNDFVNDWHDTALVQRIGDTTNGLPNKQLGLSIKGMTGENKPLRVTVNFRPTDANQLWYDRNFLDWPDNDLRGQYMRVYKTNNEIQLLPMLQVNLPKEEALSLPTKPSAQPVIPTSKDDIANANSKLFDWLDKSLIDFYSMTVSWVLVGNTPQLQILIPTTLVSDPRTGAPAYFTSTMLYRPNGQDLFSAGSHEMKLAWIVQLDHDRCAAPDGKTFSDYCLKKDKSADTTPGKWTTVENAPAHIYYENFFVTSLMVEEDLQAQAHIVYEQPDATAKMTDQLALFGYQAEQMVGREGKGMQETFTALTTELGSANRLRLQSTDKGGSPLQRPDVMELGSYLATTVNPQLLTDVFGSHQDRIHSLMTVMQTDQRIIFGKSSDLQAAKLTIDLSQANKRTATAINMGHFKYKAPATASSLSWESLSAQQAWDGGLGQLAQTTFNSLPESQRVGMRALEFQAAAVASHRIFSNGIQRTLLLNTARFGTKLLEIAKQAQTRSVGAILPLLMQDADIKATGEQRLALISNRANSSLKSNDLSKLAAGISRLAAVAGHITASMEDFEPYDTKEVLIYWGIDVIGAAIDSADAVPAAFEAFETFTGGSNNGLNKLLNGGSLFDEPMELFGKNLGSSLKWAIGIAIVAAVILGALIIFQLLTAETDLERKRNFAENIGLFISIVGVMILSIIISTGVGAIILAVIGAIDAVIGLICGIINGATDDNIEDNIWIKRLCGGIGGLIKEGVAFIVYNADPTIDITAKDRISFGTPTTALVQNNGLFGMSAGNQMKFTLPVSTLMVGHGDNAGTGPGKLSTAELQRIIREKNFFNYEIVQSLTPTKTHSLAVSRAVPNSAITNIPEKDSQRFVQLYGPGTVPFTQGPLIGKFQLDVARQETVVDEVVTLQPGVNWQPDIWLREYYKISMVECGIIEFGCNDSTAEIDEFDIDPGDKRARVVNIDIKDMLQYDVFPATLAEFYTLRPAVDGSNRYRLAWDINDFPLLSDADGDGLVTDGTRNVDPDDSKADTDGDGLSDKLEVGRTDLDPTKADTDGDGLSDSAELRYGTKPDKADTDGDGLSDKAEIDGWAFVYVDSANAEHTTWVTSNPFVQDTDGDQILDGAEKTYGFHPRVASAFNVLSMQSVIDDNDGYLKPSQTVPFTATVKNELRNRTAYGLLEAALSGVTSFNSVPTPFEIDAQQSQTLNGNFTVPSDAQSGTVDVRIRAGANIVEKGTTFANQLLGVGLIPKPQLLINFEQGYGGAITDASGNNATVNCEGSTCPTLDRTVGNRAYFNQKQWYRVNSSALAFNQPAFTVSAVIDYDPVKDETAYKEATTMVVFGKDFYDSNSKSPFELLLVDTLTGQKAKPRLTFNSCRVDFTNTIIEPDRRELLTISYNGSEFLAYKNGVLSERIPAASNCANATPDVNGAFAIGRGSYGDPAVPSEGPRVQARTVIVYDSGPAAAEGKAAEPFLLYQNSEDNSKNQVVWSQLNVNEGTQWYCAVREPLFDRCLVPAYRDVPKTVMSPDTNNTLRWLNLPWRGTATFMLCEDDGGQATFPNVKAPYTECDNKNEGNDQLGVLSTSIIDPGFKGRLTAPPSNPNNDGAWAYDVYVTNNFFNGHVDDIAIYNSALTPDQIAKLASGWSATFHLDEGSGRSSFRNAGIINSTLTCKQSTTPLSANQCPLSGVLGAAGQSLYFDGATGRDIRADNMRDILSQSLTVSMWVKPERGMSSAERSVRLFGYGGFALTMNHNATTDKAQLYAGLNSVDLPYDTWTRISYAIRNDGNCYVGNMRTLEAGRPLSGATSTLVDVCVGSGALPSANVPVPVIIGANGYKGYVDEISIRPISASSTPAQLSAEAEADLKNRPAFNLPFDDAVGATRFTDTFHPQNNAKCFQNLCPQIGVKGQVREAVQFNGSNAAVEIDLAGESLSSAAGFTLSGWFKTSRTPSSRANIVSIDGKPGAPRAYVQGSNLYLDCSGTNALATVPVATNTWTHFALVMPPSNGGVRAFVNGRLVGEGTTANGCSGNSVSLDPWYFGYQFYGSLDEFSGYYYAVADEDILSLYEYQRTWFDVSNTQQFTVDADKPTVAILGRAYVGVGTTTFGVSASDATTQIASVAYWDGSAWKAATQGAGVDPSLWSFNWTVAAGATSPVTLRARATDRVGNVQETTRQLNIDTTAPTLTLTTSGTPAAVKDVLKLSGTVDETVSDIGTVDITMLGADGVAIGAPVRATVSEDGKQWSADLPIVSSYSGKVTFRYRASNTLGLERQDALAGERQFDNVAPFAGVSLDSYSVGGPSATLTGYATDLPFPQAPLHTFNFDAAPKSVVFDGESMKKWLSLAHNQFAAYGIGNVSADNGAISISAGGAVTLADATTRNRMFVVPAEDVTIMFDVTPSSVATARQHLLSDFGSYGIILKGNQLNLGVGSTIGNNRVDVPLGVTLQAGQAQHVAVRIQRISSTEQKVTALLNGVAADPVTLSGNTLISRGMVLPKIGDDEGTDFVGKLDNLLVFNRLLTATDIYNIAKQNGQTVAKVEVGLRDERQRAGNTALNWQSATMAASGQQNVDWTYTLPADLEGIYHLSLRVTDSTGNQTTYPAIWTGVIDTKRPEIALTGSGTDATCKLTDFSLTTTGFRCGTVATPTNATQTNFSEAWYNNLYKGTTPPARLYTIEQPNATFDAQNLQSIACDQFGNCTACTVNESSLPFLIPSCTAHTLSARAAAALVVEDPIPDGTARFSGLSMTTSYERPPAFPSWESPDPADMVSTWVEVSAYDVITDSVLSNFYIDWDLYEETLGRIEWTEALSATAYYVGWTTSGSADKSELTLYTDEFVHEQVLDQNQRYFAHMIVEDDEGNSTAEVRGPIFVDDLAPTSLLEWESAEDGTPTRLWETTRSRTDLACYLVGQDNRPLYQLNATDQRAASQSLYATWNDDYLALTYTGVNWNNDGDLHLYFDTMAGGALTAYNPYNNIEDAYSLVTLPDFLTSLSTANDPLGRMGAEFGLIVEDDATLTLIEWNGSAWTEIDSSDILFSQQTATETLIWLPLDLIGVDPNGMDMWLTAFATEEDAMQLWATMPANNRVNSPALRPATDDFDLDSTLVQLQHAILLTSSQDDIFDIDYCPNSIQFQESDVEMTIFAEPSGEVYEPLLNEGIRTLIPDDIETILRAGCGGTPSADSRVCNLVNLLDQDYYGEEDEIGPYGLLPSSVGPSETVTYTLQIANRSAREAVVTPNVKVGNGLTLDATSLNGISRTIGAFEQISMTVVGQTAADVTDSVYIELAAEEETGSQQQGIFLDYELYSAFVDHYIDSTGPISATIDGFDTIGLGDQVVSGIIIDQSDIAEVTLRTSLGTSATCTDVLRIGTFESDFLCTVEIPEGTADGTLVEVTVEAVDVHGFSSSHHETGSPVLDAWTFEVDAVAPTVQQLDDNGDPLAPSSSPILTGTIDIWGSVTDDHEVGSVEVCDTVGGVTSCSFIDPYSYDENDAAVRSTARANEDVAFWEYVVNDLPEQYATHALTITGIDAVENRSDSLNVTLLIDTRPPTMTVTTTPSPIAYSETNPFTIAGTVTDDSAVAYMEIEVARPDEQTVYEEVAFDNGAWAYSSAVGTAFNEGGDYVINVGAWDEVGNVAFTDRYTVTLAPPADVFIHPPTITGTLPITPEFDTTLAYTLTIADDDFTLGDQMQLAEIYLPEGITATLVTTNTVSVTGELVVLSDDPDVVYTIVVEDLGGNQATLNWQPKSDRNDVFIVAEDADKPEGNANTTPFTFMVARQNTAESATYDYAVTSDAADSADFAQPFRDASLPSGSITLSAGEVTQTLTIFIAGDTTVEADETFTVTLSLPTPPARAETIETATAIGVIRNDDDLAPTVVSTDPVADAVDVSVTATITISFSEAVSVVDANQIDLICDDSAQTFTHALSDPQTLVLTPTVPLPAGERCDVTLAAASIADLDGIDPAQMASDYTFSFTTAVADSPASGALQVSAFTYQADPSDNSPSGNLDGFIVIKNVGTGPISLDGYKLGDEETRGGDEGMFLLPNDELAAGAQIVVAEDADNWPFSGTPDYSFAANDASVPTLTPYTAWSSGVVDLDDSEDEVILLDGSDQFIDGACYGQVAGEECLVDTTASGNVERAQTRILDDGRLQDSPAFAGFARNSDTDTHQQSDWNTKATAVTLTTQQAVTGRIFWSILFLSAGFLTLTLTVIRNRRRFGKK